MRTQKKTLTAVCLSRARETYHTNEGNEVQPCGDSLSLADHIPLSAPLLAAVQGVLPSCCRLSLLCNARETHSTVKEPFRVLVCFVSTQ